MSLTLTQLHVKIKQPAVAAGDGQKTTKKLSLKNTIRLVLIGDSTRRWATGCNKMLYICVSKDGLNT